MVKVSSNFRSGLRWPGGSLPTRRTEMVICDWPAWMAMVLRVVKEGGGSRVSPPFVCSVAPVVIVTGELLLLLLLFSSVKRWRSARKDQNTAAVNVSTTFKQQEKTWVRLRRTADPTGLRRILWSFSQDEGFYLLLSSATLSLCRAAGTPEPEVKIEERVSGCRGGVCLPESTPRANISASNKSENTETAGDSGRWPTGVTSEL